MGIFMELIMQQTMKYSVENGKPPRYLILSNERKMLLEHEIKESGSLIQKRMDDGKRISRSFFYGLEIVEMKIVYGPGGTNWALGE